MIFEIIQLTINTITSIINMKHYRHLNERKINVILQFSDIEVTRLLSVLKDQHILKCTIK